MSCNFGYVQQDACTGVQSACRREENRHNLDICVLRRLWLRQGQMQGYLGLKVGRGGLNLRTKKSVQKKAYKKKRTKKRSGEGGLNLQIWDLNRAHESETTFFQYYRFSACVDANYDIKESIKDIQQTVQ